MPGPGGRTVRGKFRPKPKPKPTPVGVFARPPLRQAPITRARSAPKAPPRAPRANPRPARGRIVVANATPAHGGKVVAKQQKERRARAHPRAVKRRQEFLHRRAVSRRDVAKAKPDIEKQLDKQGSANPITRVGPSTTGQKLRNARQEILDAVEQAPEIIQQSKTLVKAGKEILTDVPAQDVFKAATGDKKALEVVRQKAPTFVEQGLEARKTSPLLAGVHRATGADKSKDLTVTKETVKAGAKVWRAAAHNRPLTAAAEIVPGVGAIAGRVISKLGGGEAKVRARPRAQVVDAQTRSPRTSAKQARKTQRADRVQAKARVRVRQQGRTPEAPAPNSYERRYARSSVIRRGQKIRESVATARGRNPNEMKRKPRILGIKRGAERRLTKTANRLIQTHKAATSNAQAAVHKRVGRGLKGRVARAGPSRNAARREMAELIHRGSVREGSVEADLRAIRSRLDREGGGERSANVTKLIEGIERKGKKAAAHDSKLWAAAKEGRASSRDLDDELGKTSYVGEGQARKRRAAQGPVDRGEIRHYREGDTLPGEPEARPGKRKGDVKPEPRAPKAPPKPRVKRKAGKATAAAVVVPAAPDANGGAPGAPARKATAEKQQLRQELREDAPVTTPRGATAREGLRGEVDRAEAEVRELADLVRRSSGRRRVEEPEARGVDRLASDKRPALAPRRRNETKASYEGRVAAWEKDAPQPSSSSARRGQGAKKAERAGYRKSLAEAEARLLSLQSRANSAEQDLGTPVDVSTRRGVGRGADTGSAVTPRSQGRSRPGAVAAADGVTKAESRARETAKAARAAPKDGAAQKAAVKAQGQLDEALRAAAPRGSVRQAAPEITPEVTAARKRVERDKRTMDKAHAYLMDHKEDAEARRDWLRSRDRKWAADGVLKDAERAQRRDVPPMGGGADTPRGMSPEAHAKQAGERRTVRPKTADKDGFYDLRGNRVALSSLVDEGAMLDTAPKGSGGQGGDLKAPVAKEGYRGDVDRAAGDRIEETLERQEATLGLARLHAALVGLGKTDEPVSREAGLRMLEDLNGKGEMEYDLVRVPRNSDLPGEIGKKPKADDKVWVIPKTVVEAWAKSTKEPSAWTTAGRIFNRQFVSTALAANPLWHAGNFTDMAVRLIVAGVKPSDGAFMRQVLIALEDDPALRGRVEGLLVQHSGPAPPPPRFADIPAQWTSPLGRAAQQVANAVSGSRQLPGVRQAGDSLAWARQRSLNFGQRYEGMMSKAAGGKAARLQANSLGIDIGDQVDLAERLAREFRNDPAAIEEFATRQVEIVGDFARSAMGRDMSVVMPFLSWVKAANKFVYYTLPAKHPLKLALYLEAAALTEEERRMLGMSSYVDTVTARKLDLPKLNTQSMSMQSGLMRDFGWATSFGPASQSGRFLMTLTDNIDNPAEDPAFKSRPLGGLDTLVLPWAQKPIARALGRSGTASSVAKAEGKKLVQRVRGKPAVVLKGNADGKLHIKGSKWHAAGEELVRSFVPGYTQAQELRVGGKLASASTPRKPQAFRFYDKDPRSRLPKAPLNIPVYERDPKTESEKNAAKELEALRDFVPPPKKPFVRKRTVTKEGRGTLMGQAPIPVKRLGPAKERKR